MSFAYDEPDRSSGEVPLRDGDCQRCKQWAASLHTVDVPGGGEAEVCGGCADEMRRAERRHRAVLTEVKARAERLRRGAA